MIKKRVWLNDLKSRLHRCYTAAPPLLISCPDELYNKDDPPFRAAKPSTGASIIVTTPNHGTVKGKRGMETVAVRLSGASPRIWTGEQTSRGVRLFSPHFVVGSCVWGKAAEGPRAHDLQIGTLRDCAVAPSLPGLFSLVTSLLCTCMYCRYDGLLSLPV